MVPLWAAGVHPYWNHLNNPIEQWFSKGGLCCTASASPGSILERQNLGSHLRSTESEFLGTRFSHLYFKQLFRCSWCPLIFEEHRHRTYLSIVPQGWRMEKWAIYLDSCPSSMYDSVLHFWVCMQVNKHSGKALRQQRPLSLGWYPGQVHGSVHPLGCWNQMHTEHVTCHHTHHLLVMAGAWQWRWKEFEGIWYISVEDSSVPDTGDERREYER